MIPQLPWAGKSSSERVKEPQVLAPASPLDILHLFWFLGGGFVTEEQKLFAKSVMQQFPPLENSEQNFGKLPEQEKKKKKNHFYHPTLCVPRICKGREQIPSIPRAEERQEIKTAPGISRGEGLRAFPGPCGAGFIRERLFQGFFFFQPRCQVLSQSGSSGEEQQQGCACRLNNAPFWGAFSPILGELWPGR